MMGNDNFSAKWRDRKMDEDEGLRTVECLRGRLLAERAASKAANEESEQIGKKVTELELQLKMEIKSRNKAEKRLKYLMKKLDSLNISYVSADESFSVSEKSEISSVSSSSKYQDPDQKPQFSNAGERHYCSSHEHHLEMESGDSTVNHSGQKQKDDDEDAFKKDYENGAKSAIRNNNTDDEEHHDQETDYNADNSMALVRIEENELRISVGGDDSEDSFDNSMALVVVVESMVKEEEEDEPVPNGKVTDVLNALRCARESLQSSMERSRHIRSNVGQGRVNGISC